MIKYNPTQNNNSELEIPQPVGYKKQFPIQMSWEDNSEQPVVEEKPEVQIPYAPVEEPEELTESDMNILLTDGSKEDKSRVASKYLQKQLGLTKEQAAALVGIWQAESGLNLNAENKYEKAGKSRYVKKEEFGIGIGQWTGNRHNNYVNYINNNGGKNNLKTQLDFAIDEIQNKYSDYLNNLKSSQTLKDATAYTYAQYVAANERNIKDLGDLYARVRKIEQRYANAHKQMYGKAGSGNFDRRLKHAEDSLARTTILTK